MRLRSNIISFHRRMARDELRALKRATAGRWRWCTSGAVNRAIDVNHAEIAWREQVKRAEQAERDRKERLNERANRVASTL